MGEEARKRIEDLVRKATVAFYDDANRSELASSIEVDYVTPEPDGHKVMVFAPDHEFEHERPVWAEMDELTLDLKPEKVGMSSYHVHVQIRNADAEKGGFIFGSNR